MSPVVDEDHLVTSIPVEVHLRLDCDSASPCRMYQDQVVTGSEVEAAPWVRLGRKKVEDNH